MATGFSTRSGPDGYRLNFETDNLDCYLLMQKIARHCVDGKPTADVVEVRHGYWIDHHSGGSFCSACKRWVPYSHHPKYCETCGARMDGKENDHAVN